MDGEDGLVSGGSQRDMDFEEPKGLLNKKRQHSGNGGAESELYGVESSGILTAYPVCMPQDRLGKREEEVVQEKLYSCCTADGSTDQASPSSMLEYWAYLHDQHNMADSPATSTLTPPATPVTHRPCPFIPVPSSVTVDPMVPSPMTDTCSAIISMSSPAGSAWDTLGSTSRSPGCPDQDPVIAAAHLHLLGESLSLIGQHLQETNQKRVSMSSSLSLLLDSLLCALAPLICLTSEVPELRSCTQHTLASTLENLAYVMPGM